MLKQSGLSLLLIFALCGPASAQEVYQVIKDRSSLQGSIHYSVIGKYKARFKDFSGTISFDAKDTGKDAVDFKAKTASISSKFPKLDRIVCSRRLLDAAQYPYITFKSKKIVKTREGYQVTGLVSLHGVSKEMTFPFQLKGPFRDGNHKFLEASGSWVVPRKEFEVIWNDLLDRGGFIVGDHVTLDWTIIAQTE